MKEDAEDAEEAEEEMGAITGAPGGRWGVFDDGVGSGVDAIDLRQCWVELDGTAPPSRALDKTVDLRFQNRRPFLLFYSIEFK